MKNKKLATEFSQDCWAQLQARAVVARLVFRQAQRQAHNRTAIEEGSLTWAHVLVEEVAEAVDAETAEARYGELIQVAAVALQWAASIKRREGK